MRINSYYKRNKNYCYLRSSNIFLEVRQKEVTNIFSATSEL